MSARPSPQRPDDNRPPNRNPPPQPRKPSSPKKHAHLSSLLTPDVRDAARVLGRDLAKNLTAEQRSVIAHLFRPELDKLRTSQPQHELAA